MELLARGRDADLFALDASTVLRRDRAGDDMADQARLLLTLEELGYPVPHVIDADGADLVMERIDGGTMLDELAHEPEQYRRYGRQLGELHERLHRLAAPAWLRPARGADGGGGKASDDAVIVHLDLHPANVILSERGPIVIDWSNAASGSAEIDAAVTAIITLGSELEGVAQERLESMRSLLIDAFLETCGTDPRAGLADAIEYRRGNPNNTAAETRWIETRGRDCLDPFYLQPRAV